MGWDEAEPILNEWCERDRTQGIEWTDEDWRFWYAYLQDHVEL